MLPCGLAPSTFGLAELPKSTGGHYRGVLEISKNEQVFVARHNSLHISGRNQAKHHEVIRIAACLGIKLFGHYKFGILPQELHIFRNDPMRDF